MHALLFFTLYRMLHAYNRWAEKRIAETHAELNAVSKAKQHEVFIQKKKKLLETRTQKIQEWRQELTDLLKSGDKEAAITLFKLRTDEDYVEPVYLKKYSPRSTLKQKLQKSVAEKGGPVHPNILPRHIRNATKKAKNEFRGIARMSKKRF